MIELFYIGMPVVRTEGRPVYGHVITKCSEMSPFTWLWGSAHAWSSAIIWLNPRAGKMGGISRDGLAIKMAVYWPRPFFAFLLTTTSSRPKKSKKELGQYPR